MALYIHWVGWIIAAGVYNATCDKLDEKPKFSDHFLIFFTWPYYIGYMVIELINGERGESRQ